MGKNVFCFFQKIPLTEWSLCMTLFSQNDQISFCSEVIFILFLNFNRTYVSADTHYAQLICLLRLLHQLFSMTYEDH